MHKTQDIQEIHRCKYDTSTYQDEPACPLRSWLERLELLLLRQRSEHGTNDQLPCQYVAGPS